MNKNQLIWTAIAIVIGVIIVWKIPDVAEQHYMAGSKLNAEGNIYYSNDMQDIGYLCGIRGDDLLWTTAMEKISKCLTNEYMLGYMDGVDHNPAFTRDKKGE